MTGIRLALVADDQRLAAAVQNHLKKTFGQGAFNCSYANVRNHVGRETDGVLVLAVGQPADLEYAQRLVQEIAIQQLPTTVILLEGDTLPAGKDLAALEPYVTRRCRWPDDLPAFNHVVRERLDQGDGFYATREEPIPEVIRRRLTSFTPSLLPLVERIALAAAYDVTVLLTGETGTGKTYLARLMHDCSPRKDQPFLTVPCGAQPANLVESAFFGHEKGAFTGADRKKTGKFEAAGSGTILLDEIDTLGLEQQAGLLRVIETGEFEPVGSNETKHCTARIVVASNWDLEEAVQQNKFRQDLYYRLNVMSFHLPSLHERVQDIAPLVRGMAARFNTKFKKDLFDIHPRAMAALEGFRWPGNIRQLENFIQQSVLVSSGPELLFEHLPQQVREYQPVASETAPIGPSDTLVHNREMLEKNVIQRALQNNGYSRARAASALGISRVTLYKKMKKYNLMRSPLRPGTA